ncbi:unnamed protein product [Mycena citricolor]|uniref:Uncharacterized protein n=1 Tax=Mycena citricolor TaxID=2018698 RepID=A0AAD2H542_9AGAR|nr:unnamed protein product [Mycena citricolor]
MLNIDYLICLSCYQRAEFLDKYQLLLAKLRHCPVHLTTIHHAFSRARINVKCIQQMALEQNLVLEGDFLACVTHYSADHLVAVDECHSSTTFSSYHQQSYLILTQVILSWIMASHSLG